MRDLFKLMDYGPAPEDETAARDWLKAHGGAFGLFIDGEWTKPGKEIFATHAPASGEKLADVTQAGSGDVQRAVSAARKAGDGWQKLNCLDRAGYLYALARLVQKHARILAVLETLDNGKPIRESRDIDIALAARHFYHHAGWAQLRDEEFSDLSPHGVAGQIIPWNFPFLMLAWKIAPALAAGNTVVLKPAEQTPLTALYFCELCQRAGLPRGVVNVVTGDGEVGKTLVAADVDKLAFTGSSEVGKAICRQTAGRHVALTLELGGKSPFIVCEDADIDSAVEGVVDAIWLNQGEVCCAGSRLLLQESIAEDFLTRLRQRMATLRVGDPLDKAIDIGAMIDPGEVARVRGIIEQGKKDGGTVWTGGNAVPDERRFMAPVVMTGLETSSTLVSEEIFGPVVVAMSFRTFDEAVVLANNTRYGLAASVWSENISVALDLAMRVKAGVVWVNSTNRFDAACGFGGYRQSGFGREGGREGMLAYLRPNRQGGEPLGAARPVTPTSVESGPAVMAQTPKNYIGGKQTRPDAGTVMDVVSPNGAIVGEVGRGNRKDIRNAVEAAAKAGNWAASTAHLRAQILYYIAENLGQRRAGFVERLVQAAGLTELAAQAEFDQAIAALFCFAALADKHDGAVHAPPARDITLAVNEPLGVLAIIAPQGVPLCGLVGAMAAGIAAGNTVVIVPSDICPLVATDFYQVLETSDVPAGVVNIVTGDQAVLGKVLADHDEVDGLWYFGAPDGLRDIEAASAANLKQVWSHGGIVQNWMRGGAFPARRFMDRATQVKNIWIPYGA